MATKQEIFREQLSAYLASGKKDKGRILDAVSAITGGNRKAAIRRFRTLQARGAVLMKRRGRRRRYDAGVTAIIKDMWETAGRICGERLHPLIPEYVSVLQRDRMWTHDAETTSLLIAASTATLRRRIATFENISRRQGRGMTKPSHLKEIIPIRRGPWDNPDPGYGEVDTVAHCGSTIAGDFCYTVQYTDVATIWTCLAAQWNKGEEATTTSIERIAGRLPFLLRGIDPDSGSEFINWHLKEWCDIRGIAMTRTRPYMKNDHGRIEQKNYANIRRVVGYSRYGDPQHMVALNEVYAVLEDYLNFFIPSLKCVEKVKIGSRYVRRYDTAKTAYQRVLVEARIPEDVKERLREKYAILNPKTLRTEMDRLLGQLSKIKMRLR